MNKSQERILKNKKLRRRRNILKRTIFFLILIFIIIFSMRKFGVFNINSIEIKGAGNIPKNQILTASGINKGENYFSSPNKKRVKALKDIAAIKNAKISFSPNRKVTIQIEKRIPKAQIKGYAEYFIIDSDYRIIEILEKENEKLMVIDGLKTNKYKKGDFLFIKESEEKNLLNMIFKDEEIYKKVSLIELKKSYANLYTKDEIKIELGSYFDLEYKFKMLDQIIKDIEETGKSVSSIKMEKGKDPIVVMRN